jgi:Fic family protein
MIDYNWQQPDWTSFRFDLSGLEKDLLRYVQQTGRLDGLTSAMSGQLRLETVISLMVEEAVKTSEIEGVSFTRADVQSSVRKNLGLSYNPTLLRNRPAAAGIGELMATVHQTFSDPLTEDMLFEWHRMLMEGSRGLRVGAWRIHPEPMQVVSGAMGKEKVHFEAPPSERVPEEMRRFIAWFNEEVPLAAPVRAAIAHLWFESIHPFEDGNGRVGRALAEKSLSQNAGRPVILSLSEAIEAKKPRYYEALKSAQRTNDITEWIRYFLDTLLDAQTRAESLILFTLRKVEFYDRYRNELNERQLRVLTRMLDEGPRGFEGGMNARKYMGITKASKATATRDMIQLLDVGVFERLGTSGGRSTAYGVKLTDD